MPRMTKETINKTDKNHEVKVDKVTAPVAKAKKETKKKETATTAKAKPAKTKKEQSTVKGSKKVATSRAKKSKTTSTTKKVATSRKTVAKAATKKRTTPSPKPVPTEKFTIAEYYDLPSSYDKTVVKLLAQTPTTLFIYWEIAKEDQIKWEEQYGKDFMEKTKPVLIVHNETNGSSFETEIHDFANCWYLQVPDSNSRYRIELGRRLRQMPNQTIELPHNYLYVSTSNDMDAPNDHVLFDTLQNNIYYRNVKTNKVTTKKASDLYFMKKLGNLATIRKLYEKMYQTDDISHIYDLTNPSSQNPTSTFH